MSEYTTYHKSGTSLTSPRSVTTGATNLDWSSKVIPLSAVASDYLTLSTFDVEAYTWAVRLIRGYTPEDERKVGRWLQYEGLAGDGYFVGAGDQAGGRHYVVRLSGSVAHSFLAVALRQGAMLARFKCTRFDVQYTRPEAPSVRLEEVGKLLEAADWSHHKGKKPKIEWWHNAEGYDTLYIGSRSSVRLQRIYVKPVDGRDCLRWEVEYKGELAGKLFAAVLASGLSVLAGVLAGEMVVLPVLACPELVALVDDVKGGNKPERLKLVRDRTPELRVGRSRIKGHSTGRGRPDRKGCPRRRRG